MLQGFLGLLSLLFWTKNEQKNRDIETRKAELLKPLEEAVLAKEIRGGFDDGKLWIEHPSTHQEMYPGGLTLTDLESFIQECKTLLPNFGKLRPGMQRGGVIYLGHTSN